VAIDPSLRGTVMKSLIYERTVGVDSERVGIRLYRADRGFIAERVLVQRDNITLVQILPIASKDDFDEFVRADPHHSPMGKIYQEVRNIIWKDGGG
jgi:hypothetical protein